MKYNFILGIGRSGTTFLGKMVGLTTTPSKVLIEPITEATNIRKGKPHKTFCYPDSPDDINDFVEFYTSLKATNELISIKYRDHKVEREDSNYERVIIKEVHSLLTFPTFLEGFDHKSVIVIRDIDRIIDSYFFSFKKGERLYLRQEFDFIRLYLKNKVSYQNPLLEEAIARVNKKVLDTISKPLLLTTEIMRQAAVARLITAFLEVMSYHNPNIQLVRFEELCQNPVEQMVKLFVFLDLSYSQATLDAIVTMTEGTESGNFDTRKNSANILSQQYKLLTKRRIDKIKSLN